MKPRFAKLGLGKMDLDPQKFPLYYRKRVVGKIIKVVVWKYNTCFQSNCDFKNICLEYLHVAVIIIQIFHICEEKKFHGQEWVWPNIVKLLSESISDYLVLPIDLSFQKNIGIDCPHAMVTIKQPFYIFLKNSHGQKWAWPNRGQITIWDKIDASNRFVMSKNMVIEYPHVMVTIKQRFHISLKIPTVKNGCGQRSVKWWSESKKYASNRFVMSKNMGIEYPHAMVTINQRIHIFVEKFPRSEMGVAVLSFPHRFEV